VKSLIAALKDADEEVRMWSAEALKRIGTPEALKAVKKYKSKIN
jgi:HEAT repeat protein